VNGQLRVGSLFAGIGGFDLGFERAGMQTVWQVEQNPYCRAVLAQHFPDAERFEDVCDVGAAELEPVDVICGGFPCQDISLAGKGAGLDGARSGLWSEYARIVRELEPRWVVVENVSALLGRGLDRVLRDLAEIGYDAEWDCLPASAFGAPHQRDRLWIVAYPGGSGRISREPGLPAWQSDSEGRRRGVADADEERRHGWSSEGIAAGDSRPPTSLRPAKRGGPRGDLQDPDERALQPWRIGGRAAQTGGAEWWSVEPPVGRVAHGVPNRLDRLAALGNALVPQIAEFIGERIVNYERATSQRAVA
jgi:DNA (cytosine-5)-methyltransferase 1